MIYIQNTIYDICVCDSFPNIFILFELKYIYTVQILPVRITNYNFHTFKNIKACEFGIWHMECIELNI